MAYQRHHSSSSVPWVGAFLLLLGWQDKTFWHKSPCSCCCFLTASAVVVVNQHMQAAAVAQLLMPLVT
jgi:hypothetical protein